MSKPKIYAVNTCGKYTRHPRDISLGKARAPFFLQWYLAWWCDRSQDVVKILLFETAVKEKYALNQCYFFIIT